MFQILTEDAYDHLTEGDVICVTTNGVINVVGNAVMGKGCAKFVRDTFKGIDKKLGSYLKIYGNRCFNLGKYSYKNIYCVRIVSFPTKNDWKDSSDLSLIEKSAKELLNMTNKFSFTKVYIPIPGCSNGKLHWRDVKPCLTCLDKRFVIYSDIPHIFD